MNWSEEEEKEFIESALSWKLYLIPNEKKHEDSWEKFKKNYPKQVENICQVLTDIFQHIDLANTTSDATNLVKLMWPFLINSYLYKKPYPNPETLDKLHNSLQMLIRQFFSRHETSTSNVAQWKYIPVPNEPDKHDEYQCDVKNLPDGLKLIGARVRGKSHKHNGTNCDDWFEFAVSGDWTIIAVSDGAGSKKLSRVGAKVSCEAAVKYLAEELKKCNIAPRTTEEELTTDLARNVHWAFVGEDIESVQKTLHSAMKVAYKAVEKKAEDCKKLSLQGLNNEDKEGSNEDDIKLEVRDLSATLLLAVHTTVKVEGNECSLVLTCQIGDGMLAAISQEGKLKLLGKPDSGAYGGQTEFLTSKKKLVQENLLQKTFVFPGQLKALMVMTDGVADDYFPNDPGMLELYGDLILNQIIDIRNLPSNDKINEELRKTGGGSIDGVKGLKDKFQASVERILADDSTEPKQVCISSVADYAKELHKTVPEVVASPELLAAAIFEEGLMSAKCKDMEPEEKLQLWLDSYYRRGSFDDRTLVVLYREEI